MKRTFVKKHALAFRRILCALLVLSMFSPSLAMGAESSEGVESGTLSGTLYRADATGNALAENDTISADEALLWKVDGITFDDQGSSTVTLPTGLAADGSEAELLEKISGKPQKVSFTGDGTEITIMKPQEEIIAADFELLEEKVIEDVMDSEEDTTDSKEDVTDSEEDTTDSKEDVTDSEEDTTDSKEDVIDAEGDVTDSEGDVTDSEGDVTNSEGDATDSEEDVTAPDADAAAEVNAETVSKSLPVLYSQTEPTQEIQFLTETKEPQATETPKTTETAQTEYVLSVPCKIDAGSVSNGTITIEGLTLQVSDGADTGTGGDGSLADPKIKLYKDAAMKEELSGEISLNDPLYMKLYWGNRRSRLCEDV